MEYETKHGTEKQQFPTGAQRDTSKGKGRYDLLYAGAIKRDAALYERGASHYGDNNWRKGIPSTRFMESLLRHAFQYLGGDRSEDHLAAVRFNAAGIMYNEMEKQDQHNLKESCSEPKVPPAIDAIAPRQDADEYFVVSHEAMLVRVRYLRGRGFHAMVRYVPDVGYFVRGVLAQKADQP